MTKFELMNILSQLPNNAKIMSNSGWECCETEVDGIWYNAELNEVHLTQGGEYEKSEGYSIVKNNKTYHFISLC